MRIATTLGAVRNVSLALGACFGLLFLGAAPAAAEQNEVPEEVSEYVNTALIPRLVDLYGPGADGDSGIAFSPESSGGGEVIRIMEWTEDFRAGVTTDRAVQATDSWAVAVSDSASTGVTGVSSTALGVAIIWISPYSNQPELASFFPSDTLGSALTGAPEGSLIVHDEQQRSWFALNGSQLTQLAQGDEAVPGSTILLSDAQESMWLQLETQAPGPANNGFVIAGLTVAFVVVLLAIFVLVPDRRQSSLDPDALLGFSAGSLDRD